MPPQSLVLVFDLNVSIAALERKNEGKNTFITFKENSLEHRSECEGEGCLPADSYIFTIDHLVDSVHLV